MPLNILSQLDISAAGNDFLSRMAYLRKAKLEGRSVTLSPYGMSHLEEIVRLRNQPVARYNLSQDFELSIDEQRQWILGYEARPDEVGFVVSNKRGQVVGTSFLYNFDAKSMEIGRAIFNTERLMGQRYALETCGMITDLAMDFLHLERLLSVVKEDNTRLLKFFERLNWSFLREVEIRNNTYRVLEVLPGQSAHASFEYIMDRSVTTRTGNNE